MFIITCFVQAGGLHYNLLVSYRLVVFIITCFIQAGGVYYNLLVSYRLVGFRLMWMYRVRKATVRDIVGSPTPPVRSRGHKRRRTVSRDFNNRTGFNSMMRGGTEFSVTVLPTEQQSTVEVHPNN